MQNDIKNIVWLASYPKSGNTWFRAFLQNVIEDSEKPVSINMLNNTFIASDIDLFNSYVGTNSSDLTIDEIRNLRPEVYKIVARESTELLYIKVHDAWELNSLNNPIFPEEATKAVLYLIRNPLEISISFAHHSNISIEKSIERLNNPSAGLCMNPSKLFNQLRQKLLSWSEHVISWTEKSNLPTFVLRYEDMITDPFTSFANALRFIDIKYTDERILKAISHSKFEILQSQEKEGGFKEKTLHSKSFFRTGSVESWKNLLSEGEKQRIIKNNHYLMEKYGYLP
jgi:hypothetical protein